MDKMSKRYFMPPEWETHARTLISWPVRESMVYPSDYKKVMDGYREIIDAIAEFEPVTVLAHPLELEKVREHFHNDQIDIIALEHDDAWLRDNGPTFVRDEHNQIFGMNWKFNAWGEKYTPYDLDNEVAGHILTHFGIDQLDVPLVMEGGSIHVDGEGTLITTEECLLNRNRNPHLTKAEIEGTLKRVLGIEKIIWLKRGLSGDETDGHVDNIACFAAPGKVMMQVCNDLQDENYDITQENMAILKDEHDAQGRKLEVIEIEQPPAAYVNGQRLTLSYINFYFVNNGIILPVFGGEATDTDRQAQVILQKTFPTRSVRTVDGRAIIKEGGNVHCTTQQMINGLKKFGF
ncbi:agmatine deiminase family protein [Halalkalibacter hemicellulosilyticus]|nr:agmatine deiminase family protein [Halalkalibacter hemicellulosilyticus]